MSKPVLILTPLQYYTQNDEDLFFAWLGKIKCIESFKGIGEELHVQVKSKRISDNDLLDLIGIFHRYKLRNPEELKIFMNDKNKDYFQLIS